MGIATRGIAMLAVLGSLLGCGYSVHASLDPRYQTVHVSAFQNQSREFDLQGPLTTSLSSGRPDPQFQCRPICAASSTIIT